MSLLRKNFQLQDYTTIGSVGSASQQMAGHRPDYASVQEPGTVAGETLALYYFGDNGGLITADEVGAYALTNVNTAVQGAGLFGGSTGAASLNGTNQYFTASQLLGTTPTAIALDCWVKLNSLTALQYIFLKMNTSNANNYLAFWYGGSASPYFAAQGNTSSVTYNVRGFTPPVVSTWYYLTLTWDATYGLRLWVNGVLEGSNGNPTTLMGNGSYAVAAICGNNDGGPSNFWNGSVAYFRIRNKILDQHDVDVAYSTKYTWPSTDINISTAMLTAHVQEAGDATLPSQLSWGGLEVARSSSSLYRYGGAFAAADRLKILIRE